jgi:hypothetical protein
MGGNYTVNCDTGFQRFQPVPTTFDFQSARIRDTRTTHGPEARVTIKPLEPLYLNDLTARYMTKPADPASVVKPPSMT